MSPSLSLYLPLLSRKKYEVDNLNDAEFVDFFREAHESISIKGNFCLYPFITDTFSQCPKARKSGGK
jgi:hypothetical protein